MKRLFDLSLIIAALFTLAAGIMAIDSAFKHPSDEQMAVEDQSLDQQIKETIQKIESLHKVRNFGSLHMAPQQTQVRLTGNGECIEINAHAENHEMPVVKSKTIDYKLQNINVCFNKEKLTRIESAFTAVSMTKREKTVNNFIHKDPLNTMVNDIVLSSIFNERKRDNLRVGDLQNSYTKPMRISFKKDYYLPHLRQTAYILERTLDLHRHEAIKANTKAVKQYVNSAEP